MADQDFNIKVVTTADTSGLVKTREEIQRVREAAEKARQDAGAKALFAREAAAPLTAPNQAAENAGLAGTAIGLGTIVTLLTTGIRQWKAFNAEQDRWVDGAIKAAEKARELGESILEIQDKARNAARVGVEPLYESFIRLQQEIIRLKTEQSLLNLPGQGEEWKKLNAEVSADQALLRGVTSELQKQAAEREKAAEKKAREEESFIKGAVETASPQVQLTLQKEAAARAASEAGQGAAADMFTRSAEALKRGMTAGQREEYEGLSGSKGVIDAIADLKRELVGIWR